MIYAFRTLLLWGALASSAPTHSVAQQPWFALQSNFWINLHHFLYAAARARRGLDPTRSISIRVKADTVGFDALSPKARDDWAAVLAYYDSALARRDVLFDSTMIAIDDALATDDESRLESSPALPPSLVRILDRAAPVYRQLWWPGHAAENRRWMDAVSPLLARYADTLARTEERLMGESWPTRPVRVDVSAYANWAGAYTTTTPPHIHMSSLDPGTQGDYALETLFHEILHTMDDSLFVKLDSAANAQHKTLPRDPTHPFIFYTAGELVRRVRPGHVPYAEQFGLWSRGADFVRALPVLRSVWQPYLEGRVALDEAVARYVRRAAVMAEFRHRSNKKTVDPGDELRRLLQAERERDFFENPVKAGGRDHSAALYDTAFGR